MRALSSHFFITLRELDLENISLSYTLNLTGVSYHIDCQWQVSCSGWWEFAVPDSYDIIFKTKSFFWILHQILNILIKKMIVIATWFRKFQTVKNKKLAMTFILFFKMFKLQTVKVSNAIIFKTKIFFWFCCSISGIYIKF